MPVGPMEALVRGGWQVTIPRELRRCLGLSVGDRVEFVVTPDGRVEIRRIVPSTSARGGAWTAGGRHYVIGD